MLVALLPAAAPFQCSKSHAGGMRHADFHGAGTEWWSQSPCADRGAV